MKNLIKKIMWKADNIILYISAIFLLFATILATVNAVMRFSGLGGFAWSDELCVILMIFMVFLSQPMLEGEDMNLKIGILDNLIKGEKARKVLQIFRGIVIIATLGYLLNFCFQIIEKAHRFNYTTSVLHLPRFILYAFIAASFILIIINWIVNILFKKPGEKHSDSTEIEEKEEQS